MPYSSYRLGVHIKDLARVILFKVLINNGFLFNTFKMVQMTRWRSCSDCYDIGRLQPNVNYDGRHGVKTNIKKLKSILMGNFWMLGHVGNISSNAYSSSLMALGAIPLSTYVEKAKKLISLCAFTKKRKEFVCVHHVCVIAALMTTLNQCSDS